MNKKLGLILTYVVYLFVIIGTLIAILHPLLVSAKEKPKVVEPVSYAYQLGDKVPEFVIKNIIAKYATSTKADLMLKTIYCESHYWNVQSNIIDRTGSREVSFGLAQINIRWNPSVTKEQALDIEFAIKWMFDHWETTKWYGLDRDTQTCNPIYE